MGTEENTLFKTDSQLKSEKGLDDYLESIAPKESAEEPPEKAETPGEEPKETSKEEPKEPPKEESKETPKEQPQETPAETPKEEEVEFKLEKFNETFGTSFEDEESLKGYLSRMEDLKKLEGLENKSKELEAKYQEAREQLNPRKHFVSDEEYKRQLILQKYGEEVNPGLLNKIVSQDVNKMSDLDVLILGKQVGNPNLRGGDEGARKLIYDSIGVNAEYMEEHGNDPSGWDDLIMNRLSDMAAPVRKSINELKKVEIPQVEDFEAQKQATIKAAEELQAKRTEGWTKVVDRLIGDFKEYKYLDDKSYVVDDDFKKMAKDVLLEHVINSDIELDEENIQNAKVYLESEFWQQRGMDILKASVKDVESSFTEKKMKESDNPKPRNDTEAPPGEKDKQMEELRQYLDEGKGTGKGIKLG